MTQPPLSVSPQQLEQAFSLFNEASAQLAEAYQDLQQQAVRLTDELAVANGELRRQYHEKAALSRRLSGLLEALPGGVIVMDAHGLIIETNPAAYQMLGENLIGTSWAEIAAAELVATNTPHEWDLRAGHGTLGKRRISIVDSPLDESGGKILLLHDVTDAHSMHQQLELHKRLSAMGEMAAGLAHQLRTPLATALLYTAHLTKPDLQTADRVRFAEKSLARLRHLEMLIQEVLLFVKGEQGGQEIIPMASVASELQQVIEPQLAQAGLRFNFIQEIGDCEITGQRKALLGALLNLLENAIQFSEPDDEIRLSFTLENNQIRIDVEDQGCGISDDIRERLFDPFFTTRSEGTGLGLAIVRSVIKAHGGEISLVSTLGQGSLFTVTLPVRM